MYIDASVSQIKYKFISISQFNPLYASIRSNEHPIFDLT
jgi:hypothetical protein